ncbi:hypothetical protein LX15_003498 [Streptoalloteichus tenebrarius]|uniref:Methyltransferase MycE N-terminal domain-containing protein n=1 Tax=Streptoalloteichus tenebrarius (strain ATCC 17920 / DSM 40477 / JCM 4838 / CBS 697.72 / NBRC 16177 / NCIMB 11028 / NRRL B-12390 / A12253. 1 / ISP 5477) TaxID=1933 RepID=A0ABT1HWA1_STRSD|nr:class I SAM-dependent methyltransferase [Streptoalloteichus tenebrarius]MCP2259789.1 hypothetical protein [Streptoalloteichus tenebrarius]BFE99265.1 class I SAM-dependent methyltransferase [Streptoalloteichus tenebrarius]
MSSQHIEVAEALIGVGNGNEAEISATARRLGFDSVASYLLAELAQRCTPITLPRRVATHVRLGWGERMWDHGFVFGPNGMTNAPGVPSDAHARISVSLVDLVHMLLGTGRVRESARWTHRLLPESPAPERGANADAAQTDYELVLLVGKASQAILGGARQAPTLTDLAVRFDSDKWGSTHWYAQHYQRHFESRRDEPVRVLEIGIGGYDQAELSKCSLHMWQHYFHRGLVFGVDIGKKRVPGTRVRTFTGDQGDPGFLSSLASEIGPLDVVIDDGSHRNDHVLTSFRTLFPLLRDDGIYVIEDLHTSYWRTSGGDPDDLNSTRTSTGFLKTLVDGLHHQEYENGRATGDPGVVELHFYHNIAFIQKGVNDECGPEWMRRFGYEPQ